ncbi:MAG: reactive intermediate/imine deaminase [Magnetococcales bacterium]|nr:reactive intermediate/imine deaminase [Magnetococcales bacterium]
MSDIEVISSQEAPAAVGPYSQATVVAGWAFLSGQIALDPQTGLLVEDIITTQTEQVLRNIDALLRAVGAKRHQIVKTTVYLVDLSEFKKMNAVYEQFFMPPYPARSTVQVAALPQGARVEIEAVVWLGATP